MKIRGFAISILVALLPGLALQAIASWPSAMRNPHAKVIPVWPHLKVPQSQRARKLHLWPTLTAYRVSASAAAKAGGTAVVVCPGGGYVGEAVRHEGYAIAHWLNTLGISAFVLNYRIPPGKLPPSGVPWPLQDVRRAMQIVRYHATAWHIDVNRIGVMGFSAGGSVASLAGVHWLPGNPAATDPLDRISTRPDFLVLGYPVISMMPAITHPGSHNNLLGGNAPRIVDEYFSSELNVTVLTPPTFMFYAHNDPVVNHQNEKRFAAALRRCHVPVQLVEFQKGSHGFGLGIPGTDSVRWPKECAAWMSRMGYLKQ